MHVHIIVHEAYEGPGTIEAWCIDRKHFYTRTLAYLFDPLPRDVEDIDMLIIMGGPQSTSTTLQECPYFDREAEEAFIRTCFHAGKIVIGFCLGAQLVGDMLGAPPEPSPEVEIGWFPITLTEKAHTFPELAGFGRQMDVMHWHTEMPGLTPEAKILAWTEGCPRQIVQYSEEVFAFQCHPEMTSESTRALLAHGEIQLRRYHGHRYTQTASEIRVGCFEHATAALWLFLDTILARRYSRYSK